MLANFIFWPRICDASERRVEVIAESKNNRDHFWTPLSVNFSYFILYFECTELFEGICSHFFRCTQLKILN